MNVREAKEICKMLSTRSILNIFCTYQTPWLGDFCTHDRMYVCVFDFGWLINYVLKVCILLLLMMTHTSTYTWYAYLGKGHCVLVCLRTHVRYWCNGHCVCVLCAALRSTPGRTFHICLVPFGRSSECLCMCVWWKVHFIFPISTFVFAFFFFFLFGPQTIYLWSIFSSNLHTSF